MKDLMRESVRARAKAIEQVHTILNKDPLVQQTVEEESELNAAIDEVQQQEMATGVAATGGAA